MRHCSTASKMNGSKNGEDGHTKGTLFHQVHLSYTIVCFHHPPTRGPHRSNHSAHVYDATGTRCASVLTNKNEM